MSNFYQRTWFKVWATVTGALAVAVVSWMAFYLLSTGGDIQKILPSIRVLFPGEYEVTFKDEGAYAVFHEYIAVTDSGDYSVREIPYPMTIKVFDIQRDTYLEMRVPRATVSYSFPGRAGISKLEFDVSHPGLFRVEGHCDNGDTLPRLMFAFGPQAAQENLVDYGIILFLGSFVIALIVIPLVIPRFWRKFSGGADPPRITEPEDRRTDLIHSLRDEQMHGESQLIDRSDMTKKYLRKIRTRAVIMLILVPAVYAAVPYFSEPMHDGRSGRPEPIVYILLILAVCLPMLYFVIERVVIGLIRRFGDRWVISPVQLYSLQQFIRYSLVNVSFILALAVFFITGRKDWFWYFCPIGVFWIVMVWPTAARLDRFLEKVAQVLLRTRRGGEEE